MNPSMGQQGMSESTELVTEGNKIKGIQAKKKKKNYLITY